MITNYMAQKILNALLKGDSYYTSACYMALSSTVPTVASTNTSSTLQGTDAEWNVTEPDSTTTNYGRVRVYLGDNYPSSSVPSFRFYQPTEGTSGTNYFKAQNLDEIHFNAATVAYPSAITYVCLFDTTTSSSGQHLLAFSALTTSLSIAINQVPTILKDNAIVSLTNAA